MAEESILADDFLRELIYTGEVDIVIGVPTFNDSKTVGQVLQAVRTGLLKYFPRQRAVILNADGGSRDGTQNLVRAAAISDSQRASDLHALRTLHSISTQYPGGPSSGNALYTIVAAAELLRAGVCAVVSPESVTLQPEWVDRLLRPVLRNNVDLVTPVYCRHKFDGLLVRNLLYPVMRALYCMPIREPYPPEFAFSAKLTSYLREQSFWSEEAGRVGPEMCLVVSAITGGFNVGQAALGPKCRVARPPADLVLALRQTVGVLFWMLQKSLPQCARADGAPGLPEMIQNVSLDPIRVNRKRLHQMFVRGVSELEPVLSSILQPDTLVELKQSATMPEEKFRYSDELWVKSVYEFAAAYHKSLISRDHIVQALAPLYRGRAYTFLVENRDADGEHVEQQVESLCRAFEQGKPYLLQIWDAGR